MNPIRDLDLLASIAHERQAEMRREAWIAHLLRGQNPDGKMGNTTLKRKLALISAVLATLLVVQLFAATSSATGGAGL